MTTFPTPVYETRPFELGNQFSHLWWHKLVNEKGVVSVDRSPEGILPGSSPENEDECDTYGDCG